MQSASYLKSNARKYSSKRKQPLYDSYMKSSGCFLYGKEGERMKVSFCSIIGVVGSAIAAMFGGWDSSLATLLIFMGIDYLSGMLVAGVFHKSTKTDTGALESNTGFKGICRKGMILLIVLVAYRLDLAVGATYIRNTVIIAFIANETISIVENAGLMGVPMPDVVTKAIDILQKNEKKESEDE